LRSNPKYSPKKIKSEINLLNAPPLLWGKAQHKSVRPRPDITLDLFLLAHGILLRLCVRRRVRERTGGDSEWPNGKTGCGCPSPSSPAPSCESLGPPLPRPPSPPSIVPSWVSRVPVCRQPSQDLNAPLSKSSGLRCWITWGLALAVLSVPACSAKGVVCVIQSSD
jgi:hypothetical protein